MADGTLDTIEDIDVEMTEAERADGSDHIAEKPLDQALELIGPATLENAAETAASAALRAFRVVERKHKATIDRRILLHKEIEMMVRHISNLSNALRQRADTLSGQSSFKFSELEMFLRSINDVELALRTARSSLMADEESVAEHKKAEEALDSFLTGPDFCKMWNMFSPHSDVELDIPEVLSWLERAADAVEKRESTFDLSRVIGGMEDCLSRLMTAIAEMLLHVPLLIHKDFGAAIQKAAQKTLLEAEGDLGEESAAAADSSGNATAPALESTSNPSAETDTTGKPVLRRMIADPAKAAAVAETLIEEKQVWANKLSDALESGGLPLLGSCDVGAIADELDRRFPWMKAANEFVRTALTLRSKGRHAWFWMPPLLLDGPPGVGKTTWAKALAKLAGTRSYVTSCAGHCNAFFFAGSNTSYRAGAPGWPVTRMLDGACANPVLLLDEIDKTGSTDENGRLHDALLPVLEPETSGAVEDLFYQIPIDLSAVTWVFTSNDASKLPEHLRSRLTIVKVGRPDPSHLPVVTKGIVASIAGRYGIDEGALPRISEAESADLRCDFEDHRSLRTHRLAVEALIARKVSGRTEWTAPPLGAETDRVYETAVHEAGHAVCGLACGIDVLKATVVPEDSSLGHVLIKSPEGVATSEELASRIVFMLGGRAAEIAFFGPAGATSGVSSDVERAEELARDMVSLGMSSLGLVPMKAKGDSAEIEAEVARLVREAAAKAAAIVAGRKDDVERLARELVARGTLRGDALRSVAGGNAGRKSPGGALRAVRMWLGRWHSPAGHKC